MLTTYAAAQQIVCTAASTDKNVAWTIGEMLTETVVGDLVITQGFNQAAFYIPVGMGKTESVSLYKVYPNPVINILSIANPDQDRISWKWADMSGVCMESGTSVDAMIQLNVSRYPIGEYVLTVSSPHENKSIIILKKEQ